MAASGIAVEEASDAIENDIKTRQILKLGSWRLCRDFLVKTGLRFDVKPTRDLLWAYTATTKHSIYGAIAAGTSYQLVMHFPKKTIKEKVGKSMADAVLPALAGVSPWTFLGHSPELEHAWKRRRRELVDAAAQRRASVLENAQSAR